MELKVRTPRTIEDGKHTGKISRLEYRHEPYEYLDVYIETKSAAGDDVELKYGCALGQEKSVTKATKLGKLLMAFGAELEPEETVEPEKFLVGKKVGFMTITEESERGSFARVVDGSLKPLK